MATTQVLTRQQYKLEKELASQETDRELIRSLAGLFNNPAMQLVLAFTVIETLQRVKIGQEPVMPSLAGTLLESALASESLLSSLGGLSGIAGLVGKFIK